jgi:hypothetical protein
MRKRCVFGMLVLTVVLALIGLLAFTSESVHRVPAAGHSLTDVPWPALTPPAAEPETGPLLQDNGLMLTY